MTDINLLSRKSIESLLLRTDSERVIRLLSRVAQTQDVVEATLLVRQTAYSMHGWNRWDW